MQYQENEKGKKYGQGRLRDSTEDFDDMKVLLPDDIIVVDIDNLQQYQIDAFLKTFKPRTQYTITDRGLHLYYKTNSKSDYPSRAICSLGFDVEYKKDEVTVKRHGIEREVKNKDKFEEIDELFYVISKSKDDNMLGMFDGDGRYHKMFAHNIKLKKRGVKNTKQICKFINDYVFGEPMVLGNLANAQNIRESEMTSLLETDTERAVYLIDKFKPVLFVGKLYVPIDGIWTNDTIKIKGWLYKQFPRLKIASIEEIYKQLSYRLGMENKDEDGFNIIKFKNGIIKNGRFLDIDYDEFTPFYIDWDLDYKVVPEIDRLMEIITQNDKDFENYIYEFVGNSFNLDWNKRAQNPRFHILIGDGGNGKSILLKLISDIFDERTASTVKPDQFNHNSNIYSLFGKLINIGDDIKNQPLNDETLEILKNSSSCDKVTIREMYEKSESMKRIYANMIFTSNHELKSFEKGMSFKRRIRWVPFKADMKTMVDNGELKEDFFEKVYSDDGVRYFLWKVFEGYCRVYNNGYTYVESIEEHNKDYHSNNDNVQQWLEDVDLDEVIERKPKDVYEEYKTWAISNLEEEKMMASATRVKSEVQSKFKVTVKPSKVNGMTQRVYREVQ